jgi:hypothetical protein
MTPSIVSVKSGEMIRHLKRRGELLELLQVLRDALLVTAWIRSSRMPAVVLPDGCPRGTP